MRVRGHVAAAVPEVALTVGTVTNVDTQIWMTAIGPPGLIITLLYCARALWIVGID